MDVSFLTIIFVSEIILILLVIIAFLAYLFMSVKGERDELKKRMRKNRIDREELERAREANQQALKIIRAVKDELNDAEQLDGEEVPTEEYLVTLIRTLKQDVADFRIQDETQRETIDQLRKELESEQEGEVIEEISIVVEPKQQITTLQDHSREQSDIVMEIRGTLESDAALNNAILLEKIDRLDRLLGESNTVIQMLESELATQEQAGDKSAVTDETAIEDLQSQLKSANDMIMNMMTMSGDQSYIVGFSRDTVNCHSYDQLVERILGTASAMGVDAVVQIRGKDQIINRGYKEDITNQLVYFTREGNGERFEMVDEHVLIQFPTVSLLLCNLSDVDSDTVGRYRDTFATILELSISKIERIHVEQINTRNKALLEQVVKKSDSVLGSVEERYLEQKKAVQGLFKNLTHPGSSLKEIQNIVATNEQRINDLFNASSVIDGTFKTLISTVSQRVKSD